MELDEIIKKRRSVRTFTEKKVDRSLIYEMIETARLAPSASNIQPWRFIYIDDESLERINNECLGGIVPNRWAANATGFLILCAKPDIIVNRVGAKLKGLPYYLIDAGIAGEHLVLKATELGVGTCWIGWFNGKKIKEIFSIPKEIKIVSLIAIGYPAAPLEKHDKKRLKISKILFFNGWNNKINK